MAKLAVNNSGICWTTTTPGLSAGSASITTRKLSVPPVEAPIQTIFSVVRAMAREAGEGGGMMTSADNFCGTLIRGGSFLSWAWAAALTESLMATAESSMNCRVPSLGLRMMSTAPASSACINVCVPSSVSDEHITTGMGRWLMILRRKEMPSMRGISTSSVMTSGTSFWMILAAA